MKFYHGILSGPAKSGSAREFLTFGPARSQHWHGRGPPAGPARAHSCCVRCVIILKYLLEKSEQYDSTQLTNTQLGNGHFSKYDAFDFKLIISFHTISIALVITNIYYLFIIYNF